MKSYYDTSNKSFNDLFLIKEDKISMKFLIFYNLLSVVMIMATCLIVHIGLSDFPEYGYREFVVISLLSMDYYIIHYNFKIWRYKELYFIYAILIYILASICLTLGAIIISLIKF